MVYAIGGDNGNERLNIVERYDPQTDKWEFVAPMQIRRSFLAAAALNGSIFALGGSDGALRFNDVEKYDPDLDRWESAPAMQVGRGAFAAVKMKHVW